MCFYPQGCRGVCVCVCLVFVVYICACTYIVCCVCVCVFLSLSLLSHDVVVCFRSVLLFVYIYTSYIYLYISTGIHSGGGCFPFFLGVCPSFPPTLLLLLCPSFSPTPLLLLVGVCFVSLLFFHSVIFSFFIF